MTDFVSKWLMFLTIVFINFYNNNDRKMKKGRLKICFRRPFILKRYI